MESTPGLQNKLQLEGYTYELITLAKGMMFFQTKKPIEGPLKSSEGVQRLNDPEATITGYQYNALHLGDKIYGYKNEEPVVGKDAQQDTGTTVKANEKTEDFRKAFNSFDCAWMSSDNISNLQSKNYHLIQEAYQKSYLNKDNLIFACNKGELTMGEVAKILLNRQ